MLIDLKLDYWRFLVKLMILIKFVIDFSAFSVSVEKCPINDKLLCLVIDANS